MLKKSVDMCVRKVLRQENLFIFNIVMETSFSQFNTCPSLVFFEHTFAGRKVTLRRQ